MSSATDGLYEQGLATRREVLGSDYVERSLNSATELTQPFQELVTEYCWGAVWNRPGLDRKSRSLLNIGMLTALNRQHELRAHLKGALTNGVTREEIREILMQVAIYAGVPCAVDSFRVAREVLGHEAAKS